ncbi:mediator complex subunit MED14-domain-containing protein [Kalaharituber pfeilii]|nr:mediator complex subunit MED14-domain-containing protein [Kalaharituber pfeilii]
MTPGVMSEHALTGHGDSRIKASSEPATNNASHNSSKLGKDCAVSIGNGNGGGSNVEGENGDRKLGKEKDNNDEESDEEILDISVLAPALPHITQGFYPLKMLIGRMIQESHTQLRDLVSSLQDAREMDRRIKLIEHVVERRQQFIKLLVLSIWARRAEEVSQVIDVKAWFDSVEQHFLNANYETFALRRDLANAKVPNPDLKTAIEVLTTGRAPTVPSYHYIPADPLTPQQLLKAFRNINTLLSIRLNIHETLPPHFRDYRIQDGRATFWVKDEFEVDLSIGEEDPSSQLYIIDFRLTYEPAIRELPQNRFRQEIEMRSNEILRTKGLAGLYDFLHDFVMTHKIMTLRRQALEMLSGRWTEMLHVNMHKRTLIIYYWTARSDVRNWIEIGVMRPRGKEPSRLGVRWHREGKEVKDVTVPINTKFVSAEELIKTVTALHAKHILTAIRDNLAAMPIFPQSCLSLMTSDTDSFKSSLNIQLTPTRLLTVQIEPITGRFALQQPHPRVMRAEGVLNDPKSDLKPDWSSMGQNFARLRFLMLQEEIEMRAKSTGWEIMKLMQIDPNTLKEWFGPATKYLTYMRRKSWKKNWIIVIVFGDLGESWWVAEIQEAAKGYLMPDVQRIPVTGTPNVTYQFLDNLEKMACGIISHYVNARILNAKGVQYTMRPSATTDPAVQIPDLLIRFDALMKQDWAMNVLVVSFHGLSTNGTAKMIVRGRAKDPMTQLQSTNIQPSDTDVAFHLQSGGFALRFMVPVGDSIIEAIVERLYRIERLIGFVKVIRKYKLACHHVSLGRIAFTYGREPNATAEISFSGDKNMQLHLPEGSPHTRIKHFLEQHLNGMGLEMVVQTLAVTQNILVALEEIENDTPEGDLFVLSRSTEWYRMDYPRRNHVIDIQLKVRKSQYWWHVRDAALAGGTTAGGTTAGGNRVPAVSLAQFWSDTGIRGTMPLRTGLAAHLGSVGNAIRKIHSLIMPNHGGAGMGSGTQSQGGSIQGPNALPTTATLVLPMGAGPVNQRQP